MAFRHTAAAALVAFAVPAAAQEPPVDLGTWSYDALAPGWRASALIDNSVFGDEGETQVGTVSDIAIGATGTIDAVTVETEDAVYAVPWAEMDYDPAADSAVLPGDISRFEETTDLALDGAQNQADAFLASMLMGQELAIEDDKSYGRVDDLVFSGGAGQLQAIVVAPEGETDKLIALPWQAVRLDPEGGLLTTPYSEAELNGLEPFSYDDIEPTG